MYLALPDRCLIETPFSRRPYLSYGIVAYSMATQRWLLVRRHSSAAFMTILRGSYRKSQLSNLIPMCAESELSIIQQLLNHDVSFETVYDQIFGNFDGIEYAKLRWIELSVIASEYTWTSSHSEPEWLWPKGRLLTAESPLQGACREFTEETGIPINLSIQTLLPSGYLSETFDGFSGKRYETRCWVVLFASEITPCLQSEEFSREIGGCEWVSTEEALRRLSSGRQEVLNRASELISEYFRNCPTGSWRSSNRSSKSSTESRSSGESKREDLGSISKSSSRDLTDLSKTYLEAVVSTLQNFEVPSRLDDSEIDTLTCSGSGSGDEWIIHHGPRPRRRLRHKSGNSSPQ